MSVLFVVLLALALGLPVLLMLLLRPWRGDGAGLGALGALLPLASLPALGLALLPAQHLQLHWMLLDTRLQTGGLANAMLLLIGIAWTLSGWLASARITEAPRRFACFWLACLFGIVLAVLAADLATFYFGYVVMSLAAYGLVVHDGSDQARRAGSVYLVMTILAEGAVLAGLLLLAADYGMVPLDRLWMAQPLQGTASPLVAWLLLAGFGVKMGVAGLHLWLPVAHPVAPVPASAILSGVIVKAGMFGLVRLLPAEAFPAGATAALVGLGLFTAFYGVAMGLGQQRLKTVLAYSTVSQMGLLFAAAILALAAPDRSLMLPMLGLLVLHHGLNKAALFVAAGHVPLRGRWALGLMLLPALALVALPLSSGALAKQGIKLAFEQAGLGAAFGWLLGLGSAATALLLWRALNLARTGTQVPARIHPSLPLLVAAGILVPWLWAVHAGLAQWPDLGKWGDGLWPVLLAAALAWAWLRLTRTRPGWGRSIPEGDLLVAVEAALRGAGAWVQRHWPNPRQPQWPAVAPVLERLVVDWERRLGSVAAAGLALMSLLLLVWLGWGR